MIGYLSIVETKLFSQQLLAPLRAHLQSNVSQNQFSKISSICDRGMFFVDLADELKRGVADPLNLRVAVVEKVKQVGCCLPRNEWRPYFFLKVGCCLTNIQMTEDEESHDFWKVSPRCGPSHTPGYLRGCRVDRKRTPP